MKQFFGDDFADRQVVLKEDDRLILGQHTLTFFAAPMVHWPEVMVSYDDKDRILFSADGFGKFGALDTDEPWADEARRYYIGIVGKYGMQVQALLKKAAGLEIQKICPLHGPALSENLAEYLRLYDTWSSYRPETEGVVIAYTSVYGGTKQAALQLEKMLKEKDVRTEIFDLARCDMFEAVAAAFRYSRLALATTTYNNDVFPYMHTFLHHLVSRGYQNRHRRIDRKRNLGADCGQGDAKFAGAVQKFDGARSGCHRKVGDECGIGGTACRACGAACKIEV